MLILTTEKNKTQKKIVFFGKKKGTMNDDFGSETTDEESWLDLKYNDVLNAVERGDGSAKTKLAWLKLSGVGGTEKDEDGAVLLLEERVKEGDDEAMWMLGVCNECGIGTEQDIERAEDLYKQSSERGNEIGMFFAGSGSRGRGRMGMCGS